MAQPVSARSLWNGYVVGFDGAVSGDDAESYFFPNGVPASVALTIHGQEVGLTNDSGVRVVHDALRADLQRWLDAAEPAPPDAWKPGDPETAPSNQSPGTAGGGGELDPHAVDHEYEVREWIKKVADGGHLIGTSGEIVAIFAGEAAFAAEMIFGTIGGVAALATAFIGLWDAFHAGLKTEAEHGFCYGLMWGACDVPFQDKVFLAWPPDSAEERREAFGHGVHAGAAEGKVTTTRNKVLLLVAADQLKTGSDEWAAQSNVLNDFGSAIMGQFKPFFMPWPKPADDAGF
jgi:hypothetical protein